MAHVQHNSGQNEWYTPSHFIESARTVMGSIDVDPASNDIAQRVVKAGMYFTSETNGLDKPLVGNVWMNPPYSAKLISEFCIKLAFECVVGNTRQFITLTNNATETVWFSYLMSVSDAVCLPMKRIRFIAPDGTLGDSPLQGQCFCYKGSDVKRFSSEFQKYGTILRVVRESA
jgi:hypothetical protein